jgi:hypothetical protein
MGKLADIASKSITIGRVESLMPSKSVGIKGWWLIYLKKAELEAGT